MDLFITPGVLIYYRGNTIDFIFINILLYISYITLKLNYSSDYEIIITDIPITPLELFKWRPILYEDPEAIKLYASNVSFLIELVLTLAPEEINLENLNKFTEILYSTLIKAL